MEENIQLRKAAARKDIEMKKQKCQIKMAKEKEVIRHHQVQDTEKERSSNRYDHRDNTLGMQDNYHKSSQGSGSSKGQSSKGPPNAKKTKAEGSGPGFAGTSKNNFANLQEPQYHQYAGNLGPQYPPPTQTKTSDKKAPKPVKQPTRPNNTH